MSERGAIKKGSFVKWIANILIIAGAATLLLLISGVHSNKKQQSERLNAFAAMKAEAANSSDIHPALPNGTLDPKLEGIEGILDIPQIDLEAPVLLGADEQTLSEGLGAIENMDQPGVIDGSYAIAGHQSHVFGKYFNRLHEMEAGQEFTYETLDGIQRYKVFDIQIVKPEKVEILDSQNGIALLSLITCYPERSNEYRLIVQAKRIQ
ncbi:class D sortase [Mammaliicoccus sciuri]|uniref:Sortase A n=1 Tax=Sporosarcina newyorkensis TaxID=759851 RepID=A0A1T4XZV6_9BACL|nr:class D sortase [Sporosarcina newyorkensis]SKA95079.1 sortase A [Sporosarcina newyorkensis]